MKHSFVKFLGVVLLTALFSCNNETTKTGPATTETSGFSLDSVKTAIAASNKTFGETFATGDSATFANCYTSDACLYVTGMPKMCGTAAITAFFNGGYKMGMRRLALTTEEVMGGKDAVVETGKYEVFMEGDVSVDKGKFIVVWKEENGKWKMYRDIWNSDAPPPAPSK
jgi:ketosteroid isomerase-like protein